MTAAGAPASWWAWLTAEPGRKDIAAAVAVAVASTVLIFGGPDEFDTGGPEVAAGVGAFLLVLFRRRWPWPLLAVALAWSVVHALVWDRPSSMIFAALVLLATACVRLERGPALVLGAVVGFVLYGMALFVNDDVTYSDARSLIALAWTGAAVGVADAVRSWRRYRESVDAQVRSTVLAAEARTHQQVTEERLAIARELHDLLAHNLSVMNVQTGAALHLLRADPDRAEEALTTARDAGRSVLDELRELLAVLRDDGDDGAPRASVPTLDDLAVLVDTMRSAGLAVTWTEAGEPGELAPAVSLAAYRIVQESLTNAAKHGDGRATLVTEWSGAALTITVTNPVPAVGGRDGPSGGHGLAGMRERAVANGGSLDAGATPGGFAVRARLPLAPGSAEAH